MVIFLTIIFVIIVYILIVYNSLIKTSNKVKQARSTIDVYLTQRFDLIPNLVECVKGYMNHEKDLLESITQKRTQYMQSKDLKKGEDLNTKCNQILLLAENYPELNSSEQFLNLQKSLSKMESQLQAARRIYNAEVTVYNNKILMFPSNILANSFGFKEEEFFEAETNAKNNVIINNMR